MQGHKGGSQWQQFQSRLSDQDLINLNEVVVRPNPVDALSYVPRCTYAPPQRPRGGALPLRAWCG